MTPGFNINTRGSKADSLFPWLNIPSSQSAPLATSTQASADLDSTDGKRASSSDHLQGGQCSRDEDRIYATEQWKLHTFSRLRDRTEAQNTSQNVSQSQPVPEPMDTSTNEDKADNTEAWESWDSEDQLPLLVKLAGFGHLCILRGTEVLESYFLILSKKWMKAVLLDDEVLIMAKQFTKVNRLRLTFNSTEDALNFYRALSQFASAKPPPGVKKNTSAQSFDPDARLLEVLNSTKAGFVPSGWDTEWPTDSLEGLVKLCLRDPNFPGFVRQVDRVVKKLTRTSVFPMLPREG
ncbi:unnamed protein product [Calicophoron daubneyi]|uniref:Uncharacterized protein n=1 Tax=Calicophoron daubneyi TaxID=300641 RepID=A0AAV2T5W0_CALDB